MCGLILWLAIPRGNLRNVVPYVVVLAIGAAVAIGAWIYGRRSIVLTDSALIQAGPFKRGVSVPWTEITSITRFDREGETDIVDGSGRAAITIYDGIDRRRELLEALQQKLPERYVLAKYRPGK